MTSRRSFIKALAALPPVLAYRPAWAQNKAGPDPSRLALVIGNSDYPSAPLGNPVNDAKAVTTLLMHAGFTVDSLYNGTRQDMTAAIERFGAAAKRSDIRQIVFYYAGHGAQLEWRNYLLPVDAIVEKQEHMKQRCVDLGLLLGQLSAAKDKTHIVILDACRNNPFGSGYRPEQKGLSQFDAPVGSLLAYATSPGNVASDGDGANGLYTENLVRELSRHSTRVEDALKRVRLNVRLASQGAQVPWETTSLEGDVYLFNEGQKKLSESELEKQVEADITEWTRIKSSKKLDDWTSYLRNFPNGRFAEIAQLRLTRLLAEVEQRAAEERQREERRKQEEQQRLEQQRLEREKLRLADEQRLAEEKRLAGERRQREELRVKEEQRLALERKQREDQQLREAQRNLDEQAKRQAALRLERERATAERKRQEQETLLTDQRKVEEARLAEQQRAERERIESDRLAQEKQRREESQRREEQQALAKRTEPKALVAAPGARIQLIEIRAGIEVPQLIPPSDNPYSAGRFPLGRVFTVGDTFVSRQTDILTGVEENTRVARVTRVDLDEDRVEYNDGMLVADLMGNPIKNGPVQFDNPVQFVPAELQVGKKWTAAFRRTQNGNTTNAYFDFHIARRETITVPAGRFDCFRIDGEGWNTSNGLQLTNIAWIVPGLNVPVKREQFARNKFGRIGQSDRNELVSLRQQATGLTI
jgi:hypothetical protein